MRARKPIKGKPPKKPKAPIGAKPTRVPKPKKITDIIRDARSIIITRFKKAGRTPPVRYSRPTPKDMKKLKVSIIENQIATGYLLEFNYGVKQMAGRVGGWKNDPRPVILVFMDDKFNYIEGINTNYLSEYYMKKIREIMKRFPGVGGEMLYDIFKKTAKPAIKGYRKYIRSSLRNVYMYVYADDVMREVDRMHKERQKRREKNKPKGKK